MAEKDPILEYYKSISPYTKEPDVAPSAGQEQPAVPAEPATVGGTAMQFGRDIGAFGGGLVPGAANLLAIPLRLGYDITGREAPGWLNKGSIENALTPPVLRPRTPEEERYRAAGEG